MRTQTIGNTDIQAPVISLGTWSMGGDAQWGEQDDAGSLKAIDAAVENGITMIDTAPAYGFGHSEELVGQAIRRFKREDLIIETKCGVWWKDDQGTVILSRDGRTIRRNLSRKAMLQEVDDSLMRLGLDYIDIYVTHQQPLPPFNVEISEIMGTLNELKKAGKIRAVGISNASLDQLREYMRYGQVDLVQERYSMLDQKKINAFLPICREYNITVQAYSPLEQGLLTGKIGMDYVLDAVNVRNKIAWFQPEKRQRVLDMLEGWKDLCGKYGCGITELVIAWTLSGYDRTNVICGGRKIAHVLGYIKGGELALWQSDLDRMNADIKVCVGE
ncbi:aldo/keto reductase [Enterocloster hominis (ex Hitch et al. 2024)]|uniref:Aldo/keto reductase n=1 Tax=Enterocloster hominis (ex Hitch et al. 2024) TaxID=1917870 RepID=A0ABV1D9T6_9FIRM